jgi:prepilin-type N-terminal cleavage/methylation domain-containing protein
VLFTSFGLLCDKMGKTLIVPCYRLRSLASGHDGKPKPVFMGIAGKGKIIANGQNSGIYKNGGGQSSEINTKDPVGRNGYNSKTDITGTYRVSFLCNRGSAYATGKSSRGGFTLVEVIVVIVIIAILAAIGVPALTGYIDKAQDRTYIAEARDYFTALRTVIDEAYANGEFQNEASRNYIKNDKYYINTYNTFNGKAWNLEVLSKYSKGDSNGMVLPDEVNLLLNGKPMPTRSEKDFVAIWILGSMNSTLLNADGFMWEFYPDGTGIGKHYTKVTYKVDRLNLPDGFGLSDFTNALANGKYNPDAGYEVYRLIRE